MSDTPGGSKINNSDLYLKGREFLRKGNFEDGIRLFETILKGEPDNKEATYYIAVSWEKQEEFLMAQIFYKKTIEIDPLLKRAWERLYYLYDRMKNWEDFHEFFEKNFPLIDKADLKIWLLEKVAITYLIEKKLEKAEKYYRELLRIKPGYNMALINLARVYQAGERQDKKALEILMRAYELDRSNRSLLLYLSRVLRKSGINNENALKIYREVFKIDKNELGNSRYLKKLFIKKKELSDPLALEVYSYFIERGEGDSELYFHRGLIWKNILDWKRAIEDFKRAQNKDLSQKKYYIDYELSYCYYQLSDYLSCSDKLKIHLKVNPDDTEGWKLARKVFFSRNFNWKEPEDFDWAEKIGFKFPEARTFIRLGDYAKNILKDRGRAEKLYIKALELNQDLPGAMKNLEEIYEFQKNWEALFSIYSVQLSQGGIKKDKKIYYLYKMADLKWQKLKDYDKALEFYQEILKLFPEEKKVYLHMANMAREKKEPVKAREYLMTLLLKDICNEELYSLFAGLFLEERKGRMAAQAYGVLRLLNPLNKELHEFFSTYSCPAVRENMPWEKENEDLLIHENEKSLIAFLTWSKLWCEKLYSPRISDEVLSNASMATMSYRPELKEAVNWCSKRLSMGEIPVYVYSGKKNIFPLLSCLSPQESYIIFHEGFLKILDERELLFLIAHELCHIKREHHYHYRLRSRFFNWTLEMTSRLLFNTLSLPEPQIWRKWTRERDMEELDFETALLGLDFTADRYGLFFSGDIEAATCAIWKKYAFINKKNYRDISFGRLMTSKKLDKDIFRRLKELWIFSMSPEYEAELMPVIIY